MYFLILTFTNLAKSSILNNWRLQSLSELIPYKRIIERVASQSRLIPKRKINEFIRIVYLIRQGVKTAI